MQKLKNEAVNGNLTNATFNLNFNLNLNCFILGTSIEEIKKEADEKWTKLKPDERAQLLQEFHKVNILITASRTKQTNLI